MIRRALALLALTLPLYAGESRAFNDAKVLVGFGPRPSGSLALEKTRRYLLQSLRFAGLKTSIDAFQAETPGGSIRFANVIAEKKGRSNDLILIAGHFDTKPFEGFSFVGANDGASSAAAVLELARRVALRKDLKATYRFVFFDGEEAVCRGWDQCMDGKDHTYGSRHMVEQLRATGELRRVKALILLDMVGEKGARFQRDTSSTPWLTDVVWKAARRAGVASFSDDPTSIGGDDHFPFLEAGVPAVDIIDLDYRWWHTAGDTLDKLSAASIDGAVNGVLAALPDVERAAGVKGQ